MKHAFTTTTTALAALLLAGCSSSMNDDKMMSSPVDSPKISAEPSEDRGQSYGEPLAPSPAAETSAGGASYDAAPMTDSGMVYEGDTVIYQDAEPMSYQTETVTYEADPMVYEMDASTDAGMTYDSGTTMQYDPVDSPQVSVSPSGDRGASYGEVMDPSPLVGVEDGVTYSYGDSMDTSGPIDSPQVSVKPSGDRGASYGERMDPSPAADMMDGESIYIPAQ